MSSRIRPVFGCLTADPPWKHGDKLPGKGRGAQKHYPCMSTPDICRMVLPPLAADCWLWLWRLHTHHDDAIKVAEAWGFDPKPCSELVWVKTKNDGTGVRIGMGRTLRMSHEVCLLFRRGKPKPFDKGVPSVILSPRLEHSRKPDDFYRLVDRFVGPHVAKAEMFARRHWPGWTCFGDQLPEAAE